MGDGDIRRAQGAFNSATQVIDLKRNANANVATQVQEGLNALGHNVGRPDGDFGPTSIKRFNEFRESQGLPRRDDLTAENITPTELALLRDNLSKRGYSSIAQGLNSAVTGIGFSMPSAGEAMRQLKGSAGNVIGDVVRSGGNIAREVGDGVEGLGRGIGRTFRGAGQAVGRTFDKLNVSTAIRELDPQTFNVKELPKTEAFLEAALTKLLFKTANGPALTVTNFNNFVIEAYGEKSGWEIKNISEIEPEHLAKMIEVLNDTKAFGGFFAKPDLKGGKDNPQNLKAEWLDAHEELKGIGLRTLGVTKKFSEVAPQPSFLEGNILDVAAVQKPADPVVGGVSDGQVFKSPGPGMGGMA